MRYLFDTNICVHIIRKHPENILARLRTLAPGDVGISSITLAELQYGVQKSQRPEQNQEALLQFLVPFVIADFDYSAAIAYGHIRTNLEKMGTPIGSLDMLIAAHAIGLGVTLVTNNRQEFARIKNLELEDWITA